MTCYKKDLMTIRQSSFVANNLNKTNTIIQVIINFDIDKYKVLLRQTSVCV